MMKMGFRRWPTTLCADKEDKRSACFNHMVLALMAELASLHRFGGRKTIQ